MRAPSWPSWQRALRGLLALALAVGLSAWVSLGDLVAAEGHTEHHLPLYGAVTTVALVVVVLLAGWHALWLLRAAMIGFLTVLYEWFWTDPTNIPGGMDGIGYTPGGSGSWAIPALVVMALALLIGRAVLRRVAAFGRRRRGPVTA